jgi:hypothetical protein
VKYVSKFVVIYIENKPAADFIKKMRRKNRILLKLVTSHLQISCKGCGLVEPNTTAVALSCEEKVSSVVWIQH